MGLRMYEKNGMKLQYRDDTTDKDVINKISEDYGKLKITSDDLVLDLGAHIGSFSIFAMSKGAKVIAIEAAPDNFELLKENIANSANVGAIVNAAVTGDSLLKTVKIYMYAKRNRGMHTILPVRKNAKFAEVQTVQLNELLKRWQPSVIKCDIEGGEYSFMQRTQFPKYVKQIAIEWHIGTKELKTQYLDSIENLMAQGFKVVEELKYLKNTVINVYAR